MTSTRLCASCHHPRAEHRFLLKVKTACDRLDYDAVRGLVRRPCPAFQETGST